MNISQMAALARDHWKKTWPEMVQEMEKANALVAESEAAAKLTQMEMDSLMLLMKTEQEAWQESRHLFIFTTKHRMSQTMKAYVPED